MIKWICYSGLVLFFTILICYHNLLNEELFSKPQSSVLLDKNDHLLSATIATDGQWRFPDSEKIPEKFKLAIVEFEDQHFFSHPGIYIPSLLRAFQLNISEGSIVRGGSTISMQVIRMSRNNPSRTIWEKLTECLRAIKLETQYSKNDILKLYASNAPMGGNTVGLEAAAWRYFGRSAKDLSWAETCCLAVLPNAPGKLFPGRNDDLLKSKRDRLLKRLFDKGLIDESTYSLSMLEPIPTKPKPLPQVANHALHQIQNHVGTTAIYHSTIDENLQKAVRSIVSRHAENLRGNQIHNLAVLVLDVKNNEVVSYVGNTTLKDGTQGAYIDIIQRPRSSGSILKPFLYSHMLEHGNLMPQMLLKDIPTNLGGYAPVNYAKTYDGVVPANEALSRSLNIPAVLMLKQHGTEKFHQFLRTLGFESLNRPSSDYGLSLILGGGEVTLWEICNSYAFLSRVLGNYAENGGLYNSTDLNSASFFHDKSGKTGKLNPVSIISAASVYHTALAMTNVKRPSSEFGWEHFDSPHQVAWKTGTSFGFRDAWAVGFTPNHVIGVWVGNADGEGRPQLTGITAAAPVLFDVLDLLPTDSWFEIPFDEMTEVPVCKESGHRASKDCHDLEMQWIANSALSTKPCPYHQLIHLDAAEKKRVHSACYATDHMKHLSWFVLPPISAYYYKKKHPSYRNLPEWDPGCENEQSPTIDLIYPRHQNDIYIPVQFDGSKGSVILQATHQQSDERLFWYFDEEYLGETSTIHHLEVAPEEGEYRLTIMDESGSYIQRSISFINKDSD